MPRLTESRIEENFPGADYSVDEIDFMMAMERYKRDANRPFPCWHEVLRVLKAMGYRRPVDGATKEPRPHSE